MNLSDGLSYRDHLSDKDVDARAFGMEKVGK